jgi:hypothetical protein
VALTASGKTQNVKASLEKYLQDSLEITEGLAMDFEGKFGEAFTQDEWVQETIMDLGVPEYLREKAQKYSIMLNLNVFVKKDATRQTNRHYQIRDIIGEYLYVGKDIPMYDFENGNFTTALQQMRVREVITDRPIPGDAHWQYSYTVGVEWIQKWEG